MMRGLIKDWIIVVVLGWLAVIFAGFVQAEASTGSGWVQVQVAGLTFSVPANWESDAIDPDQESYAWFTMGPGGNPLAVTGVIVEKDYIEFFGEDFRQDDPEKMARLADGDPVILFAIQLSGNRDMPPYRGHAFVFERGRAGGQAMVFFALAQNQYWEDYEFMLNRIIGSLDVSIAMRIPIQWLEEVPAGWRPTREMGVFFAVPQDWVRDYHYILWYSVSPDHPEGAVFGVTEGDIVQDIISTLSEMEPVLIDGREARVFFIADSDDNYTGYMYVLEDPVNPGSQLTIFGGWPYGLDSLYRSTVDQIFSTIWIR